MAISGASFGADNAATLLLRVADSKAADAIRRISSGIGIQTAGDDPAGLVASQGLAAQIQAIGVAIRNGRDSANLVRTADGGLSQTQDILRDMRAAALGAANAQDPTVRAAYQAEIQTAMEGLNYIAETTQFGDRNLLDGSFANQSLALGPDGESINLSIMSAAPSALGTEAAAGGVAGIDVSTQAGAQQAIAVLDSALSQVSDERSYLGSIEANVIEPGVSSMTAKLGSLNSAYSALADTDVAGAMADLVTARITSGAAVAMLSQANSTRESLLDILK